MSVFKKIKDIFYDEEIVEVPIKEEQKIRESRKENIITREETPKIETIKTDIVERENIVSERELFKPEKTFDFPVFEEEEIEKPKSRTNILEIRRELERREEQTRREEVKPRAYETKKIEREASTFKVPPVISPVYGIYDKNYKKEDIIEKKEIHRPKKDQMSYEYVRRKAYGTLEDELENTLTNVNEDIVKDVESLEKELDSLPKPSSKLEDILNELENASSLSIGEVEERAKERMLEEEEKEENTFEESIENTLEHDLFNLIDSMYEEKED